MIRLLKKTDIENVLSIQEETKIATWTKDDYLKMIENPDFLAYVFSDNQTAKGFIISRLIMFKYILPESSLKKDNNYQNEAEILNLTVKKDAQRKGIASNLLKFTREKFLELEIQNIWLEVRKSNLGAINFYEKNGFEFVYLRKNYYSNPAEDALVLKLETDKFITLLQT